MCPGIIQATGLQEVYKSTGVVHGCRNSTGVQYIGVIQGYRSTAVDQICSSIKIVCVCIGTGVVQRYNVYRNSTGVDGYRINAGVQV
jgi:hypothetical protein